MTDLRVPLVATAVGGTDCEDLVSVAKHAHSWAPSLVANNRAATTDGASEVTAYHRDSSMRIAEEVLVEVGDEVIQAVLAAVLAANDSHFQLHIDAEFGLEPPKVVRYTGDARGHFALHTDLGPRTSTRKLSYSVQLSDPADYSGGTLDFPLADWRSPRGRGSLIVFPSFLPHRVTPVVEGDRYALVGWVHGPPFR